MGNNNSVLTHAVNAVDDIGKGVSEVTKQIETGVGAIGQSVGDLFYPDNPNRRIRVEQLRNDIDTMQNDFNSLKKTMEQQLAGLQKKLNELLKANNFSSVDDMDAYMQKTLNADTLAEWNEFKKTLNRDIAIENMVMTATGLVTIVTGVVAYGLAICGAITLASAGAALEITGAIALALTAVVAILAVIDAHKEREQLQEAIRKLAFSRIEAKQALEQMRVYTTFLSSFDNFLSNDLLKGHPEWFNQFTSGNMITSLEEITWPKIVKKLKELDDVRPEHAWREEDPDVSTPADGKVDRVEEILKKSKAKKTNPSKVMSLVRMQSAPISEVLLSDVKNLEAAQGHEQPIIQFIHEKTSPDEVIDPQQLRLSDYQNALDCDCEDVKTKSKWHIRANLSEKPSKGVDLKDVLFTLTNLTTGKVFNNCRILLLGHAVSA